MLRSENKNIEERNLYLENQMEIVDWYNKIMADDINSEGLLVKYEAAQKKIVELTETVQ